MSKRAKVVRPDAVVLDLNLPGFDGLEVCRQIQREGRVPLVMLTARVLGLGPDAVPTALSWVRAHPLANAAQRARIERWACSET